jgi:hypothetical protein
VVTTKVVPSTTVSVGQAQDVVLSRRKVLAAAKRLSESDGTRISATVDGRAVSAVPLVARALGISTDELRSTDVVRALHRLGFAVEHSSLGTELGVGSLPEVFTRGASERPRSGRKSSRNSSAQTIAPARELALYQGKWVAIRDGSVSDSSESLKDLRSRLDRREALVVFIPTLPRQAKE